ncbi:MAG: cytosolic protein [Desulfobacter sp.]|nr:cytosolic protein [Desulfobacter sp.]WDP88145.1 MAG: cytosolic protein [Desulfobacter sp.]
MVVDMLTRIMVHHGLWFNEVRHQMGMEKALTALDKATKNSVAIAMKHLSATLGFELDNKMPKALVNLEDDTMEKLMAGVAKSWLANDGVWFQAVEFDHGMNDAKRCNDSCWTKFSPYEAHAIKNILGLGENPGLEGLKKALNFRMYAFINQQTIVDEGPKSFVFQMNECRVQLARQRKNLDDYPCKSAGLVEYAYFAEAIDTRIKTQCIGCPPDAHPKEWFCAWRFSLDK